MRIPGSLSLSPPLEKRVRGEVGGSWPWLGPTTPAVISNHPGYHMGTMSDVYRADGRVDVYPADACRVAWPPPGRRPQGTHPPGRRPQGTHRTDCVGPRHPPIIAHAVLQGTNIYFYFSGPYWRHRRPPGNAHAFWHHRAGRSIQINS